MISTNSKISIQYSDFPHLQDDIIFFNIDLIKTYILVIIQLVRILFIFILHF